MFARGLCLCLLFLLSTSVSASSHDGGVVAESGSSKKLHISGIRDAGKVNEFLYRGAQPSDKGLEELRRLGIDTVVDLRGERRGLIKKERKHAQSLGMLFVNLPGNGWSPPPDKQIAEFFSLMEEKPRRRVFVHCWLGGDRSGLFLAVYRIAFDGWTPEQAIQEMHVYHFKAFWHPAMTAYVRDFPARLARSAALAAFRRAEKRGKLPANEPAREPARAEAWSRNQFGATSVDSLCEFISDRRRVRHPFPSPPLFAV